MRLTLMPRRSLAALALALACAPDGGARFEYPPTSAGGSDGTGSTTAYTTGGGDDSLTSGGPGLPPPLPTTADPSGPTGDSDTGGGPVPTALIPAKATWRWQPLQTAVDGDWKVVGFDDTAWSEGQAAFGDGPGDATPIDPATAPLGLRLRHTFTVPAAVDDVLLRAYLRRGDGVAVWLNGVPLLRSNLPPDPLAADTRAQTDLKGNEPLRYIRLAAPHASLLAGDNVVAVEVRRYQSGAAGLGFDLQLDVWDMSYEPADTLTAQVRTRSYGGEYADEHVGVAWIQGSGGLVRTLSVWAEVREQHLIRWRSLSDGDNADAMTSATRGSHRTTDLAWDLKDRLGQPAPPGDYKLVVEFTEDNSNEGAPPGPVLEIPFTLGGGPHLTDVPAHPQFADGLLVVP
ncbi:DUF2271 domain-containing protein [Nannocystis sp. RBIL2]|uniref:DUF2271 domain-containing protein n=1 Tax=Nannocystis sp. RBIL2 TaxID=2996788 RepID=UPI00226E3D2C|nr:DUF2271 domain-containing protein [Nannocystis sp. RBIL2]MCY1072246.1 DUF2271 domain-containing protein [Nannocystis sp. RBIL2]